VPFFLDAPFRGERLAGREPSPATPAGLPQIATRRRARDGCLISLKKDGLTAIGGLLGLRDDELFARARRPDRHRGLLHLRRAGRRDLERLAQGLRECWIRVPFGPRRADRPLRRHAQRTSRGQPVQPAGIHAVYLNAGRLCRPAAGRVPRALAGLPDVLDGGIRSAELGSLYLGTLDERNRLSAGALRAGPAGDPAPGLHRGALRVRDDVLAGIAQRRPSGSVATGSSPRRRCCALSKFGWRLL